jgi:FkbM family methyltransferase
VIALEPYLSLYKLMKTNIKLNDISSKVVLLNVALGPNDAEICNFVAEVWDYRQFKLSEARGGECKEKVKVYTLDSLVSMFDIENAILKVDCEGCEYETILTTHLGTLKLFNQIIIEYHNGYWRLN